jgi:heterodisulfide reductase subunit A-like polyferredoxin
LFCIETFQTRIEGNSVVVTANKSQFQKHKRTLKMTAPDPSSDPRVFVVIGGGPGGLTCAESLRQEGFKGKILMISKEKHLPYDRTKLSKTKVSVSDILLRNQDFFQENGIETILGVEVKA